MDPLYPLLFICYASYAYNRKSVAFVLPKLIEEGLDKSYAGLILTCMNAAFALSESVAGALSDRISARALFSAGLLISGAATLSFSFCSSPLAFCALWALNGLAQGCGFPPCAKIIRRRAPSSQFGILFSILSAANNVAGTLSPFVATFFILNFGWRTSLLAAGLTSLFFGFVALVTVPNVDEEKSEEKSKGVGDINKNISPESSSHMKSKDVLLDPFLWIVALGSLVAYCAKSTATDWGQLYLLEEKDRSQQDASAFTSGVESGGFLGRILAGFMADRLVAMRFGHANTINQSKPNTRMYVTVLFLSGSVLILHMLRTMITEDSSVVFIGVTGFLLGICLYGPISVCGICASESAPPHLAGVGLALSACSGNVGAMLAGLPICYLSKHTSWNTVFIMLQVAITFLVLVMLLCKNLHPNFIRLKKKEA